MTEKKYRVEIVEIETGNVEAVIGRNMPKGRAELRETTGLSRVDGNNYFVRMVEEKLK